METQVHGETFLKNFAKFAGKRLCRSWKRDSNASVFLLICRTAPGDCFCILLEEEKHTLHFKLEKKII